MELKMYASASNSFKLMRCEHLKTRADDMHAKQRYREAADAYTRTIEVIRVGGNGTTGQQCDRYLDVHMAVRLHSNRSLSLLKCASDEALRDSLRDALTCVRLAPTWTKGSWRSHEGSHIHNRNAIRHGETWTNPTGSIVIILTNDRNAFRESCRVLAGGGRAP